MALGSQLVATAQTQSLLPGSLVAPTGPVSPNQSFSWLGFSNTGSAGVVNKYLFNFGSLTDPWRYYSTVTYKFDERNQPTAITEVDALGDSLRRKTFEYHPQTRKVIVERFRLFKNNIWQDSLETSYAYFGLNDNRVRYKEVVELLTRQGTQPRKTLYAYRPDGKPEFIRHSQLINNQWRLVASEFYQYNSTGLELSRRLFEYRTPSDSVQTLASFKTFTLLPQFRPDSVYESIHHWREVDRQFILIRSDSLIFAQGNPNMPIGWTEKTFRSDGSVDRFIRYNDLEFHNYIRNNLYGSQVKASTKQVWNGRQFVNDSRTVVLQRPNQSREVVMELAGNQSSFVPFERYSLPLDTFGNSLGERYEKWNSRNGRWDFNPDFMSSVVTYSYEQNSSRMIEAIYSFTDSRGDLKPNYLLEYMNYGPTSLAGIVSNSFTCYPNPATESIQLVVPTSKPIDVEIFNPAGQVVKRESNIMSADRLDVSDFRPGMYIVKAQTSQGQVLTSRFIKK